MFKLLRNKIQSLTETQKNIFTIILILANIFLVISCINFWVSLQKTTLPKIEKKPPLSEEIPEALKPGEVGEVKEGEKPQIELPPVIFNASGTIKEILKDRLIILGDGLNFSDKKPRELTVIFTEETLAFDGQKTYKGLTGLQYLKISDSISLQAPENIRGKTQFLVDYVNKI